MEIINHIRTKFNDYSHLNNTFVGTPPYPMIVLNDFLPKNHAQKMYEECVTIPDHDWTSFTRNGSLMKECNDLEICPQAFEFVNQMHSALGMNWLTKVTGITDLIPDPYLTGAGYSKTYRGYSLNTHTDFNWNDKLKLHRMLSLIIYLNPEWKPEWKGALQFKDFDNDKIIQEVPSLFNSVVIWRYHKRGFHGYPDPLECPIDQTRNTFRLFYYISDARHREDDRPHRSLYWYDKELGEPYDIPTRK